MTFAIAGSVITQSGIDANLSGLASVPGVTTFIEGNRTIYNIGNTQFVVSGTLTVTAGIEGIIAGTPPAINAINFSSGCNFTLNDFITGNGDTFYARTRWYSCAATDKEMNFNAGSVAVFNGGWTDLRNATTLSYLVVFGISTVTFNSHRIGNHTNAIFNRSQLRASNPNLVINGLELVNMSYTVMSTPASLSGLNLINSDLTISDGAPLTEQVVRDFRASIKDSSIRLRAGRKYSIVNAERGTIYKFSNQNVNDRGTILIRKELIVRAATVAGAPIQGSVYYIRDVLNAGRVDGNGYTLTPDFIYTGTTGVGGDAPLAPILLGAANVPSYNAAYNVATNILDKRFTNDVAPIILLNYGYFTAQTNQDMKGNGSASVTIGQLPDSNVTLTEANAVTKLASSFTVNTGTNTITVTAASTLDDLYDAMKAYKTRAVQAQIEYLGAANLLVNAAGTVANAGSLNIAGVELLTAGTKLRTLQTSGTITAAGSISNVGIIGDVVLTHPPDLPPIDG